MLTTRRHAIASLLPAALVAPTQARGADADLDKVIRELIARSGKHAAIADLAAGLIAELECNSEDDRATLDRKVADLEAIQQ